VGSVASGGVTVLDRVLDEIARRGPVPMATVIELALYEPQGGFYAAAGRAGRRGDFITSPEVGPLFGVVLGRALDAWWDELGRPERFVLVDAGAGPGTLGVSLRAAAPRCATALRHVMVERSAAQRAHHPEGPGLESRAELPTAAEVDGPCVVLANELLDNLPPSIAERCRGTAWQELRVGADDGRLVEVPVDLDGARADLLDRLAPAAAPGARAPLQDAAAAWLADALAVASTGGGRVVVLDYATTTARMAGRPWLDWLRTYRGHGRGGHPLDHLGGQDVTCEVATDQLALVRPPDRELSQVDWLREHGLDELVAEGKRVWAERAHLGDLAALRARSRVGEAEALTDPTGLGAFRVLEWVVDGPLSPSVGGGG
jgi:SAM-dependent MidA family methyltransferase